MNETVRTGGCMCGAVRYRVVGEPLWVNYCHCADCRRSSAAPVSVFAGVREDQFTVEQGEATHYASSPGVVRSFCATCGTPLTYQSSKFPGEVHVLIGSFDEPRNFTPTGHVLTAEQLPWLHISDDLPRE
ncbi:MAG: GFA family protein [Proteobacteria bacterium]|nr:GFA family protein [Pseudomonadota bacterium]